MLKNIVVKRALLKSALVKRVLMKRALVKRALVNRANTLIKIMKNMKNTATIIDIQYFQAHQAM